MVRKELMELKTALEEQMPEHKVYSMMDYKHDYILVGFVRRDGRKEIPGKMYKIHKKTGDMEYFSPMMDIPGFTQAQKSIVRFDGKDKKS